VVRQTSNLLAFLAAAVLPLQLPICVCASETHSHAATRQTAQGDHHAAADGHDHVVGTNQSHGDPHSNGRPHSHHPGPCHEAGHANSVPPGERDDHDGHGPCQCSPQNTPVAPLPQIEKIESPERSFHHWMNASVAITDAMGHGPALLMTHGPPFGTGRNLLSSFQGDPCALFCRWVI
jgi:hypothetical protein